MKIKVISIMVVSILIGVGAFSASAEFLQGDIDVEITDTLGLVCPRRDLDNTSMVEFIPTYVDDGNDSYWEINSSIDISLNITDNSGRENFWLPRSVMYTAILVRKDIKILPLIGLFKRMVPVRELFKTVNVVESQLGENMTDTISIPVQYNVYNDTLGPETMTLHLFVMGILPGDVNGIDGIKVVEYKAIELQVDYIMPL